MASEVYTLRPTQGAAVSAIMQFFTEAPRFSDGRMKNGIVIGPTGWGKSLVIAGVTDLLDEPVTVFQPSKELLEQNYEKLKAYGYRPAIFSASFGSRRIGEITLATIGSVKKYPHLFRRCKKFLIDECHLVRPGDGMYAEFFANQSEDAQTVGLTATPIRLYSNSFGSQLRFITRTKTRFFADVIYAVQTKELFDAGYLCPLEYKEVKTPGYERGKLKANSTGAEFSDKSVQTLFKAINFQDRIVEVIQRAQQPQVGTPREHILVFVPSINEAHHVAAKVPGAAVVSSKTPAGEREQIVGRFKTGRIPVVCNVALLGIGFDFPALDAIVDANPTMSLTRYMQKLGRPVRTHPSKTEAWDIDMVGNYAQFGPIQGITFQPNHKGLWEARSAKGELLSGVTIGERNQFMMKNVFAKHQRAHG